MVDFFFRYTIALDLVATIRKCFVLPLKSNEMNVVTIESEAFQRIMNKIDGLEARFAEIAKKAANPMSETWLDNQEVCELLKISKRTLQTYRDEKMLPFSQINHKIYYRASDLERFLKKHYTKIPTFQ